MYLISNELDHCMYKYAKIIQIFNAKKVGSGSCKIMLILPDSDLKHWEHWEDAKNPRVQLSNTPPPPQRGGVLGGVKDGCECFFLKDIKKKQKKVF